MKYILILLLITSTASAQTVRVSTNSTGTVIYTRVGVDTGKQNIRNEFAAFRAEIMRNLVVLRPEIIPHIQRLDTTLSEISKSLADINATNETQRRDINNAKALSDSAINNLSRIRNYLKATP